MKTSFLRHLSLTTALVLATSSQSSFAQTTATTDPVGFVTMTIAGNGGSGRPAYTFTTMGMTNSVAYQSSTSSVGGSTTLVDSAATWSDNAYNGAGGAITHYVEITSGPGAGTTYNITATSNAGKSLTLSQPLLASVVSGASYKIRQHWTIGSVFGTTNLQGGSSIDADQVQLWRNGGFITFYYQTSGFGGTGWRQFGQPDDASGAIIDPDDGILIQRNQSANVSIVIAGAVKTGQSSMPVLSGYTLLGNVYATGMTFGSSGLYTGDPNTGLAGGDSTTADQVLMWNGTGYRTFYYQTSGFGGTGWKEFGVGDATNTAIPVNAALFIKRSGNPFNWIAPQHPVSFN